MTAFIEQIKETWNALFPGIEAPPDHQWALWVVLHDEATVKDAVATLASKFRKLEGQMDRPWMVRFASSVMNRMAREKKANAPARP